MEQRSLADRPRSREQRHPGSGQASRRIGQAFGRGGVEPLGVVHDHEQRLSFGGAGEQAQKRGTGGEAVAWYARRRAEGERRSDRVGLRLGQVGEPVQQRRDGLPEQRIGQVRLSLDRLGLDHAQIPGQGDRLGQQRGLPDPRLADDQQRTAAPVASVGHQAADLLELWTPAEQHASRLRPPTAPRA